MKTLKRLKDAWRLLDSKHYVLLTETDYGESHVSFDMPTKDVVEFTKLVSETVKKQDEAFDNAVDVLTNWIGL